MFLHSTAVSRTCAFKYADQIPLWDNKIYDMGFVIPHQTNAGLNKSFGLIFLTFLLSSTVNDFGLQPMFLHSTAVSRTCAFKYADQIPLRDN